MTGERVVNKYSIGREAQDEYAAGSHAKAVAAQQAGRFDAEIVPVTVHGRKGDTVVSQDEGPRGDSTRESLSKSLKPAFKKDGGTVTAGNAPGLNDGAASLLIMSEDAAGARV